MDKIITVFRTKASKDGKVITDILKKADCGIDPDWVQVVYIEEQPAIATFFGIKVNPTIILFSDTEEQRRYEGLISLPSLREFIAD